MGLSAPRNYGHTCCCAVGTHSNGAAGVRRCSGIRSAGVLFYAGGIYGHLWPRTGSAGLVGLLGYGRGAWMTDAWNADEKYMWGIDRMTNVRPSREPHPLPIMDPNLFKYPYIYAVEVGQMELSSEEAARLREYLLRGGFWHVDDFWGLEQFDQLAQQLRKVFPERQIVDLP